MNDQEIIDNAPEIKNNAGALLYYSPESDRYYEEHDGYWYEVDDYTMTKIVAPTAFIRSLVDIKRIFKLEHYNVGLADESCQQQRRIAELEKENKLLKQVEQIFNDSPDLEFSRFKEMFPSEFKAHNLEQQAIGRLHGVAYALNMYCTTMPPKEFPAIGDYYANKLKAEALKDQE